MNLRDKIILVSGGTGFLGSAIVNKLISKGCYVNIISLPGESTWRIEDITRCKLYKVDLRISSETEKCIRTIQPEIIFHLAGYVWNEREIKVIRKIYSTNLDVTLNLILALEKYDYDLFINTGTSDEYGTAIAPFKETFCPNPASPYSAAKVAVSYFCEMMANIFNRPIITVRPFLPYGPKQIARLLIPWLIYSGIEKKKLLLTPCEQTRDFIYIEDVADAYISLTLNLDKVKNKGIFNIGTGKEIPILKIVNLISKKLNFSKFIIRGKPYRAGEAMHHYASIDKIKNTINWAPKWSIEDGINKTIEWWQKNREIWLKYKHFWE